MMRCAMCVWHVCWQSMTRHIKKTYASHMFSGNDTIHTSQSNNNNIKMLPTISKREQQESGKRRRVEKNTVHLCIERNLMRKTQYNKCGQRIALPCNILCMCCCRSLWYHNKNEQDVQFGFVQKSAEIFIYSTATMRITQCGKCKCDSDSKYTIIDHDSEHYYRTEIRIVTSKNGLSR